VLQYATVSRCKVLTLTTVHKPTQRRGSKSRVGRYEPPFLAKRACASRTPATTALKAMTEALQRTAQDEPHVTKDDHEPLKRNCISSGVSFSMAT
jgi:hypothetical protein